MSWYVKNLLFNFTEIQSPTVVFDLDYFENEVFYYKVFDELAYSDLSDVVNCIEDLFSNGRMDELELSIIRFIVNGYSYKEISRFCGVSVNTVKKRFSVVCNRIAFTLGGKFTNEGLFTYIKNKHEINRDQETKLREILHL
jgi:hypothetical protein